MRLLILSLLNSFYLLSSAIEIRDLNYQGIEFKTQAADWTFNSNNVTKFSECSSNYTILVDSTGILRKTFKNLPSHNSLSIVLTLYVIGNWKTSDLVSIQLDNQMSKLMKGSLDPSMSSPCTGISSRVGIAEVHINAQHSLSTADLKFTSTFSSSKGFAIRDVVLMTTNKSFFSNTNCIKYRTSSFDDEPNSGACPCENIDSYSTTTNVCRNCPLYSRSCALSSSGDILGSRCSFNAHSSEDSCKICNSSCSTCIDSASNCLSCHSGYRHISNNTCLSSCGLLNRTNPLGGLDCYSPCKSTEVIYNQTCWAYCPFGFKTVVVDGANVCQQYCSSTQYLYDKLCQQSCTGYHLPRTDNTTGVKYCDCNSSSYTLPDRTCATSCPPGTTLNSINKTCPGPCPVPKYIQNGTCVDGCTSPFSEYIDPATHIAYCVFCNNTIFMAGRGCITSCPAATNFGRRYGGPLYCEKKCPFNYYFNNTCVDDCEPPYHNWIDSDGISRCVICEGNSNYSMPDNSCVSSCPSGYTLKTVNWLSFCEVPCPNPGTYMHKNGSCLSSCPSPFFEYTDPVSQVLMCDLCNQTGGLLPDGTCVADCPAYMNKIELYGDIYCNPKCSNQFVALNGSCISECLPPYSNYSSKDGFNIICSICKVDQVVLPNNTCAATCPVGFQSEIIYGETYCRNPCSNGSNIIYSNGTCGSYCPNYFSQYYDTGLQITFCYVCNVGEYFLPDGTCTSHGCQSNLIETIVYGSTICKGTCEYGEYLFNKTCNQNCPANTRSFFDAYTYEWKCYMNISVLAFTQIDRKTFRLDFSADVNISQFSTGFISFKFSNSLVEPIPIIIQNSTSSLSIEISNLNMTSNSSLEVIFTPEFLSDALEINFGFLNNVTIPIKYPLIPPLRPIDPPANATKEPEPEPIPTISVGTVKTFETIGTVSMGAAMGSVAVSGSSVGFKGQISMVQYLMALLFLNVNYPGNVMEFLKIFKIARMQFIPNPFDWFVDDLEVYSRPSPFKFISNQFNAFFFNNVGNILFVCTIFLSIHMVSTLAIKLVSTQKLKKIFGDIRGNAGLIGLFNFFIGFSVLVTISCVLQLRSPDFSEVILGFSWFFSLFVIFGQIAGMITIFNIRRNMVKEPAKRQMLLEKYKDLFEGLRTDQSGVPNLYLIYLLARDFVQFSSLVMFYYFPGIQITSQVAATSGLFITVVKMKPYKISLQNLMEGSRELFISLIYFAIIILKILDDGNNAREGLGYVIIGLAGLVMILNMIGTVGMVIINVREKIRARKKNSKSSKRILRNRSESIKIKEKLRGSQYS